LNADLTSGLDLTHATRLPENRGLAFMGDTKGGPFDIPASVARQLLETPNPDGRMNSDVVVPWVNASDVAGRPRDMWIIDFPPGTTEKEAALYEAPFEYVLKHVKPQRVESRTTRSEWWIHERPRIEMRMRLQELNRFVVTPTVSKHRLFLWVPKGTLPDHQLIVIAREDDSVLGILHSRIHELWARRKGTQLRERESGFRYTPTSTFETFPFPSPDTEEERSIEAATRNLFELRDGWLRARPDRTLTGLYNEQPTWLAHAHRELDAAVIMAYGWPSELTDEQILRRLLELNMARSSTE
jgi:type II restriction/modification system DNA methylase subunit YeeA